MTVVGIGSTAGGDDSVGLVVVQRLRERGIDARVVDPTQLVEVLGDSDPVVLVDAVLGDQPGTVHQLTEHQLGSVNPTPPHDPPPKRVPEGGSEKIQPPVDNFRPLRPVSSHAMSVQQAIGLARVLEPNGADLVLVGIEIGPPHPGVALSAEVEAAVPRAVALIEELIHA